MSVRAFACIAPDTAQVLGYVALTRVAEWPEGTAIVRVRIGADWHCARLDRSRAVEVEGLLVRDAVPSDEQDCPEGAPRPPAPVRDTLPEPKRHTAAASTPAPVQAAAIAVQGMKMVVVLVRREVIDSPGEAALLQGALRPRFGGTDIVLMGQDDDGSPHYYGDAALVELLQGLPIERMPWKPHPGP